jgi:hypothetical protein
MEEKKLLSFIEKNGLLSAAEKAGVTLSKVEELKLLSTAERCAHTIDSRMRRKIAHLTFITPFCLSLSLFLLSTHSLGLLSLAESAASTDGALISSLSIPFFVIAVAALVLIPDQNIALVVAQDVLAASLLAGSATLFAAGFLVNALNE